MSIKIIQPLLAKYRINFFDRINKEINRNGDIAEIYFSSSKRTKSNIFAKNNKYRWAFFLGETIVIFNFFFWQKGINKINISNKDIIVMSGNFRYLSNFFLFFKARLHGAKIIWWSQFKVSSYNLTLFIKLILFQFFDGLIFYTHREKILYEKVCINKFKKPILGINNGIDNEIIKQFREIYLPSKRKFRVLYIGRITKKSNFEILIKAFKHIKLKQIKLDVIGKKDFENSYENHKNSLQSDNITFHGEIIDEKEIAKIANKCRLFVYGGSVGLSLIHAMNYGLPCIVHNQKSKHMPEIAAFEKNKTGQTFAYNNASDLALIISNLINAEDKLKKYSNNCLNISSNKFNTQNMTKNFLRFIKQF